MRCDIVRRYLKGLSQANQQLDDTCQEAASGNNFMSGWSKHVRGATKLLELRGVEQMGSHNGLALFSLVRMQIVSILTTNLLLSIFNSYRKMIPGIQQHIHPTTNFTRAQSSIPRGKNLSQS
jgi:hypothetical protein